MAINPDELALKFAEQSGRGRDTYELAREAGQSIFDEVADVFNEFIAEVRDNLSDSMDSANLSQSFEPEVVFSGNSFFFRILAADYYDYINKGVSGARQARTGTPYSFTTKKPPLFEGWAQRKGINPYAVRESVFQKGIKGTGYFDNAVKKVLQ